MSQLRVAALLLLTLAIVLAIVLAFSASPAGSAFAVDSTTHLTTPCATCDSQAPLAITEDRLPR